MKLTFETEVAAPREAVFEYFANPANLDTVYGPSCRVLHHEGTVDAGTATWIELTIGILQVVMGFEHTHYDPPAGFAERLVHGPFSMFEHRHEFIESATGTLVRDRIELEVPLVYGGRLAAAAIAAPIVRRAMGARNAVLARHGTVTA